MAGNGSGEMLYQEKKAPLEMKTEQREETRIRENAFLEEQGKSLFSSKKQSSRSVGDGPTPPVQEAPAHKFKRTLGKLHKKERTGTHSDVQREAFKRNLLDNIALDMKGNYSEEFRYALELLRQYALINITGDSDEALLEEERSLLQTVVQSMTYLSNNLRTQGVLTEAQTKEQSTLNIYLGYFSLDVNGYLEVPERESEKEKLEDYTGVTMKGTYQEWVWKDDPQNPGKKVYQKEAVNIVMKDVPKEQPLFPHEPSLNDIAQGGLGDCYLLAALSAVVNMKPQFIKDCMRDNGDGTVTVRFYKGPVNDKTAYYVKIKKAVPEGQPYARGALWVQLIEHAYTASGLHLRDRNDPANQDKRYDYGSIDGGNASDFVETITGRRMAVSYVGKNLGGSPANFYQHMLDKAGDQYRQKHNTPRVSFYNMVEIALGLEELDKSSQSFTEDVRKLTELNAKFFEYFDKLKVNIYSREDAEEFFTKLDYKELPDIPGYDEMRNLEIKRNFVEKMKDAFVNDKGAPLQYRAFSGKYTETAEEAGKVMVASTVASFKSPEVVKGLNGEAMEIGLAATHAYTLLGVKQLGENKYIKLRNPWSVGTRAYEQNTVTGNIHRKRKDSGTHGIFLLELNEFMTHFDRYATI